MSDWTESSGFGITPPPKPNVSVTMVDSLLNKRDMSWSCPFTLDDNSPFAFVEFQTAFAQDFLGWGSPTVVWSESYTVAADSWSQEDTEFIPIDTSMLDVFVQEREEQVGIVNGIMRFMYLPHR